MGQRAKGLAWVELAFSFFASVANLSPKEPYRFYFQYVYRRLQNPKVFAPSKFLWLTNLYWPQFHWVTLIGRERELVCYGYERHWEERAWIKRWTNRNFFLQDAEKTPYYNALMRALPGKQSDGHCIWYGTCSDCRNGSNLNIAYEGEAKPLDDIDAQLALQSVCPELFEGLSKLH